MSIRTYPVVIVQDRYNGVYSGGKWIAIAQGDSPERLDLIWLGAHAEDLAAVAFWAKYRDKEWLAVGDTPDEALAALNR